MSGKKKILALLIGFFVFFYACWAVGMSIYTENMPVVKAKSAVKTALTFEGTIVAHYHRVEKQQEYVSVFDATVEEVLFEDGEDVGMGRVVIRFSPDDIQTQLTELEQQLNGGLLDGVDEETKEALNEQYRLLKQAADSGELTAQTSWRKVQALVSPGDRVAVGTPLFSGMTGLIWPGICPPTTPFILNAAPRLQVSSCRYGRIIGRCPPKWICLLPARSMSQRPTGIFTKPNYRSRWITAW